MTHPVYGACLVGDVVLGHELVGAAGVTAVAAVARLVGARDDQLNKNTFFRKDFMDFSRANHLRRDVDVRPRSFPGDLNPEKIFKIF